MASHNELGNLGEALAADYLRKKGYRICEQNWYFKKAEIDIIAKKDDVLVIVEVKTRSTDDFGDPQDFITPKKVGHIVEAADEYVQRLQWDKEVRFDIIAIVLNSKEKKIEHIEDGFLFF